MLVDTLGPCAGETISDKDKCTQCKGQKVVQDKKMLEVHVEKGMQHGQKITFAGEADEAVSIHVPPRCQQKDFRSRSKPVKCFTENL